MIKKKFKVQGMHCSGCGMLIESTLEDLGINAKCSFASETLEVEYEKNIKTKEIEKAVNSLGYSLLN